jgi:hypothetical protein
VSCPLYWVQIGPRTVVSLRRLSAFCGDDDASLPPKTTASRLVIEPGITFGLDPAQAERVWTGIQKVYATEGLLPPLAGCEPCGNLTIDGLGPDSSGAGPEPAIVPGLKPDRPGRASDPDAPGEGQPGVVDKR